MHSKSFLNIAVRNIGGDFHTAHGMALGPYEACAALSFGTTAAELARKNCYSEIRSLSNRGTGECSLIYDQKHI